MPNRRSARDDLAATSLFADIADDELDLLSAASTSRTLNQGEVLIAQGAEVLDLTVVRSGLLSVRREHDGQSREVARIGPGGFVGEMALVSHEPASASVVAEVPTTVLVVPHAGLAAPLARPEVLRRVERTARRRRATNRLAEVDELGVTTTAGIALLLRPLWPDDWRLMDAGRDRISEDSLRRRFFTLPTLHEGFLRRLSAVDFLDQFAWAVLEPGDEALVAVGRLARMPEDPAAAEIALLVADDLQHQGLGGLLTVALAAAATEQGITTFTATALADNRHVQGLLSAYGALWGPGDRGQEVAARWPVAEVLAHAKPDHPVAALHAAASLVLSDGLRPDAG